MQPIIKSILSIIILSIIVLPQALAIDISNVTNTEVTPILQERIETSAEIETLNQKIELLSTEINNLTQEKEALKNSITIIQNTEGLEEFYKNEKINKIQEHINQREEEIDQYEKNKEEFNLQKETIEEKMNFILLKIDEENKIKQEATTDILQVLGKAIGFIILIWVLGSVLKFILKFAIHEEKRRGIFGMINIIITVLIIFGLFFFLISDNTYSIPIIALLGTAMAFGFRDLIISVFAWFFIVGPKGFKEDDIIKIRDGEGVVAYINIFRSSVKEFNDLGFTGNIISFPNSRYVANRYEPLFVNVTQGSKYFLDTIKVYSDSKEEIIKIEKKIMKFLEKEYENYLDKALREWKKLPDHPYPKLDKDHTKSLIIKEEDKYILKMKYVVSIENFTSIKKSILDLSL